jgi:hypothetical protein
VDTSVFGGCLDDEFAAPAQDFFGAVLAGAVRALISDTLVGELVNAPDPVQDVLQRVLDAGCERLALTQEAELLRDAYLLAGVVTVKYADDALHVAQSTLARADVLVSWNFKHLVNPSRVRAFNGVNTVQGYGQIIIMTPTDIVRMLEEGDEEEGF